MQKEELAIFNIPICAMGLYPEVKDVIFSLPVAKEYEYLYFFGCGNSIVKIGRTKNPARRFRQHEHGFATYGFTKIQEVAITRPTPDAKQAEQIIKDLFNKHIGNHKMGNEWWRTHEKGKALKIFMDSVLGFHFYSVSSYEGVMDYFFPYLETLFINDITVITKSINEMASELKKAGCPRDESLIKLRIRNMLSKHPKYAKINNNHAIIDKTFLSKDVFGLGLGKDEIEIYQDYIECSDSEQDS